MHGDHSEFCKQEHDAAGIHGDNGFGGGAAMDHTVVGIGGRWGGGAK